MIIIYIKSNSIYEMKYLLILLIKVFEHKSMILKLMNYKENNNKIWQFENTYSSLTLLQVSKFPIDQHQSLFITLRTKR
jgi:hypothetical protein